MIAVIDYGVGNIFSIMSSLKYIGAEAVVVSDSEGIKNAEKLLLPGVGAFCDAAEKLRETGLGDVITGEAERGKPLLGICLGMQLLFEKSLEFGEHPGLGLLEGVISPLAPVVPEGFKIPQIGWNQLRFTDGESPLFKYVAEGEYVYFVHSYYASGCDAVTSAVCDYGVPVTAAVGKGRVFGTQFHPEKSGDTGLNILRAFAEM